MNSNKVKLAFVLLVTSLLNCICSSGVQVLWAIWCHKEVNHYRWLLSIIVMPNDLYGSPIGKNLPSEGILMQFLSNNVVLYTLKIRTGFNILRKTGEKEQSGLLQNYLYVIIFKTIEDGISVMNFNSGKPIK